MTTRCPTCQAANSADSRFCFRCGSVLPTAWAPLPADELARRAAALPAPAETPTISGAPVTPPAWGPPAAPGPQALPPLPYVPGPAIQPGPYPSARPAALRGARTPLAVALIAAGAAVLLLAVGLFVVGVVLRPATRSISSRPASVAGGGLDAEARAAVEASNRAQIEALHTLDATPFQGVVVGQALDDNLQILADLRRNGVYSVSTLDHIEYQPTTQVDATHATIRTVESWTTLYYQQGTDQLVRRQQSTGLQEIYSLVRQNGGWVVAQIDIRDPSASPATPVPRDTQ